MKTKEQVLNIKTLTDVQRKRAEDFFLAQERFHKPLTLPANNEAEVKQMLDKMQKNYEARKAAEAKARERKAEKLNEHAAIIDAINQAKSYGFTTEDIIGIINETIRAKKNEKILAQIEELKAKLV